MKNKLQLTIPHFAGIFLLTVIVVLAWALYGIISPFVTSLIFAVIFATMFFPLYKWFEKVFGGRHRIASLVTCFITLLVIAVPLSLFITLLIVEGISAFVDIAQKIQSGFFQEYFNWYEGNYFYDKFQLLVNYLNENLSVDLFSIDFIKQIGEAAQVIAKGLLDGVGIFLRNLAWFVFSLFIFFFALYYFFKDGKMMKKKLMHIIPLPNKHGKEILKKFKEVTRAMFFGIFFTAVIQGTLAGIGYAIVGINNPIFWATATAFFSLVPLIGTAVIWVPASLFLIATGDYVAGIGLILWGMLVVATVDNFIRPYLIEGKAPVHPLLTFLAVIGGWMFFGLQGLIYGPLVLNLLIAFLHIYELEYAKVLKN